MQALWTGDEAAATTGGVISRAWQAKGLSIDTRTLAEGDLFIALKGPHFDGHNFVKEAFNKGASAAMVEHDFFECYHDYPILSVKDTLLGLRDLARQARKRTNALFIGITGSAGKTTTKALLYHCLSRQAPTHASQKSFNNHWGVPFTLASTPLNDHYSIIEMGMNHAGELKDLSELCRPHVALITTIAAAHLGFFNSLEEIADAKAEIMEYVVPEGTVLLPYDSPFFERLQQKARKLGVSQIYSFGEKRGASYQLREVHWLENSVKGMITCDQGAFAFVLKDATPALLQNILAAFAVAANAGADLKRFITDLADFMPLEGRGLRRQITLSNGLGITIIDDSYNANPASMEAGIKALAVYRPRLGGRCIAILGDMKELGEHSLALHRSLRASLEEMKIDLVFTCGQEMKALFADLSPGMRGAHAEISEDLADLIYDQLKDDDVLWIKGSNAMRMDKIVNYISSKEGKLDYAS